MKPSEFVAKWAAEGEVLGRRRAQVDGAGLRREVLADFADVMEADAGDVLNLREAAEESGYSADHLGRLVREGKVPNAGRPNAPKIRRADLPRKASALRTKPLGLNLLGATPGQIARAVVNSKSEEGR